MDDVSAYSEERSSSLCRTSGLVQCLQVLVLGLFDLLSVLDTHKKGDGNDFRHPITLQ